MLKLAAFNVNQKMYFKCSYLIDTMAHVVHLKIVLLCNLELHVTKFYKQYYAVLTLIVLMKASE